MLSRSAVALALLVPILGACATTPPESKSMGLEPPVMSPPGDMSASERLAWWQHQLPRLSSEDRSEARLAMGELSLEIGNASEARIAFYEAKGGRLAAREMAQAERGIGLSYFLDGQVALGVPHLERSREDLQEPAQEEVEYLLAAAGGDFVEASSPVIEERMSVYLDAAHIKGPAVAAPSISTGAVNLDLTRSQWGAAPMRSNWDRMTTPYRIAVHHTAEPMTGTSVNASAAEVRNVQSTHMKDRGFADIGYHYMIDRAGRVIEGRAMTAQGAHASGSNNVGNIGICLLGNFSSQPDRGSSYATAQRPTSEQLVCLDKLLGQLREVHGIPANKVQGHRELKDTECPGDELARWISRYRMAN
ncbi:MAG: N-acetylmuramoyl-L-alanine amidase [Planctomycetes bacterium]|nr:N-acetylmuramoyl-L-alanine amidase [Planctomycetota bacterium]MCP4772428.1 N-acetylmuramoyl-L-alanine amidase [Planctomycetota bacterium]MCP4860179.1 N-acetylmuramoyl-L-alanine amidase [Planctomycetota bacterium]